MNSLKQAAQQALEQLEINRTNFRKGPSKAICKMLAGGNDDVIAELRAALAEQPAEQEPIYRGMRLITLEDESPAVVHIAGFGKHIVKHEDGSLGEYTTEQIRSLFAPHPSQQRRSWWRPHPSPAKRKPLTDEQIVAKALHLSGLGTSPDVVQFARAIEAAHGITGETK